MLQMYDSALFTGTFDPFHIAHSWQLERAYVATPFKWASVKVIQNIASHSKSGLILPKVSNYISLHGIY